MKPGIYYRDEITTEQYLELDAINVSRLVWCAKSLKHFKRCPRKLTKALALGTTTHCALLEPARFASDYVVWNRYSEPEEGKERKLCPRNGKYWEAFKAANAGKAIVMPDEYAAACAIRDEVLSEPVSAEALANAETEVVLVWVDRETGLLCKGRIDWLKRHNGKRVYPGTRFEDWERPSFGDVKTGRDVTRGPFFHDAAKRHYHVKMAWYADAIRTLLEIGQDPEALVLAVESGDIHDSVVYEMSDDELAEGRIVYSRWMADVKQARETGRYPGIGNDMRQPYYIPPFAREDQEDVGDTGLDFSKGDE